MTRRSLLLVDDDQPFRERMAGALRARGFAVFTAVDLESAVRTAAAERPEVAIVDLRAKFGLKAECAERTCIVVVHVATAGHPVVLMGLIVDSVDEVVSLGSGDIEPTPDFGAAVDTRCFVGMAKVKNRVMTLLDLDRVIATEAVQALAAR